MILFENMFWVPYPVLDYRAPFGEIGRVRLVQVGDDNL